MNKLRTCILGAASFPLLATSTLAVDFLGLSREGDRLLQFSQNGAVSLDTPISGLNAGDSLVDIDVFFSADRKIYGLGTSGTLYTVDAQTGAATVNVANAALGSPTAMDFNPAVDRLRVLSGDDNFRITPGAGTVSVDGPFSFAAGDVNFGANPNLRAAAYINNVDAPGSTALYSIDSDLNALILHSVGPQFSVLNTHADLTLGGLAFDIGQDVGFDVLSPMSGLNYAFLSNGNDLYRLDLSSGQLAALGTVAANVDLRSIAVAVPEASTLWAGGSLAVVAGWLLRRRQIRYR